MNNQPINPPKGGRPRKPVRKPYNIYLSPDEKKEIEEAADRVGMLPASWGRMVLLKAARED